MKITYPGDSFFLSFLCLPMSSRKHQFTKLKDGYFFKSKEIHITSLNPLIKFSVFSFIFLTLWGLLLFIWFPETKTSDSSDNIQQTQYDQKILHDLSASKPSRRPACKMKDVSIYVYDLPAKFNLGLLQDCRHLNVYTDMCPHVANLGLGQPLLEMEMDQYYSNKSSNSSSSSWFATHQFIAEMIFHARVENHPCRTLEPERANLFYVPFYGGLHASSNFREPDHHVRDALAVELADYIRLQPWWQRNYGKDHFLALGRTAWDFMRPSGGGGPDFGANTLLNLPPLKENMSVLTVERHPWEGSNQHGIPYPSYFHPTTMEQMVNWQDKIGRAERLHLFSFTGAPRPGLEKAAVRDQIIRQCEESISRCQLLKCGHGASKCHEPMEVLKVMTISDFCLQAPGDSFTRRSTFDSLLAGCIPVFFSPHTAYSQYSWYLPRDPTAYSVYIDEKMIMNGSKSIEQELMKIPRERVDQMRRTIIDLIPTITYMNPNSTAIFTDAVDVALSALSKHAFRL